MAAIRQFTESAVASAKQRVQITRRVLEDGTANPEYDAAVAELAEVEKHFAAKNALEAMAAKQGFRRNSYAGTCAKTGKEVKAGTGFVAKNELGKWVTYSFPAVQEIVGFSFE